MTIFWEHPDYICNKDAWKIYRDLYEGKRECITSADYLWYTSLERKSPPSLVEQKKILNIRYDREIRTRYLNIPEIIVSIWQSMFFRQEPVLDTVALDFFEQIPSKDNIDGSGKSLYTFIKDCVAQNLCVFGKAIILADAFGSTAKNKSQETELGLRPFLESLDPLCVPDWEIETGDSKRIGKYNMLRHEYDLVMPRNGDASAQPRLIRYSELHTTDGKQHTITRYTTEVDQTGQYKTVDKDTKQAIWKQDGETLITGLIEIPVTVIKSESWIKDACEETLRHYNLRSVKDSIEFNQGFQRVWIKGVDTSNPDAISALSEYVIGALPENGSVEVVDPVSTSEMKESINQALENAFKVGLNQQRRLPATSNQAQTAEAQTEEKDPTIALIESQIDELETAINDALVNFAAFAGVKDFQGRITLVKDVRREDLNTWLQLWTTFRDDFDKIPSVKKAALKKALGKLDLENEEELYNDLEAANLNVNNSDQRARILSTIANGGRTNQA